jgi:hypothetical protein
MPSTNRKGKRGGATSFRKNAGRTPSSAPAFSAKLTPGSRTVSKGSAGRRMPCLRSQRMPQGTPRMMSPAAGASGRSEAMRFEALVSAKASPPSTHFRTEISTRFSVRSPYGSDQERIWRSLRDSNPCYSLERAMSWASRRRERGVASGPAAGARYYREEKTAVQSSLLSMT